MRFVLRKSKRNESKYVDDVGVTSSKSSSKKSVSSSSSFTKRLSLFGNKKKKSEAESEPVTKLIFQHTFVTVQPEDLEIYNITVNSNESIVSAPEQAQQETIQLESAAEAGEPNQESNTEVDYTNGELQSSSNATSSQANPPNNVPLNQEYDMEEKKKGKEAEKSSGISQQDFDAQDDIADSRNGMTGTTTSSTANDTPNTNNARDCVDQVAGAFIQALMCSTQEVQNCATLSGNLGGFALPATACQPIIHQRHNTAINGGKAGQRTLHTATAKEYFNDQFATKFLNGMLNVGFTLVHHSEVNDGDENDWIGRTVNLNFRPGVCSSTKMVWPAIQWTTVGGGKVNSIEKQCIGLSDVDSIAVSKFQMEVENAHIVNQEYEDELDCFFTITSKNGDVYLFEAFSPEDSHRIVRGIQNIAFRLSSGLIAGDANAVADFFDNSREPPQTQLRKNAAMMKISNAFLNGLL